MNPAGLRCAVCNSPLHPPSLESREPFPCRGCGRLVQLEVFPAFFRPGGPGRDGELIVSEEEASCFYHANKRAVRTCDACGRFLCALCDCDLGSEHLCPGCIETGKKKGKLSKLEHSRVLYDSIALALAVLPVVLFPLIYFTVITAPMALFLAIRHWNTPTSIVRRTKARHVLAIAFSAAEIAGWVTVFVILAF